MKLSSLFNSGNTIFIGAAKVNKKMDERSVDLDYIYTIRIIKFTTTIIENIFHLAVKAILHIKLQV